MNEIFTKRLRELRIDKKLTQAELGRIFGIAQETISCWEKGYSSPNIDELKNIADYFDVSTDYLLGREDLK